MAESNIIKEKSRNFAIRIIRLYKYLCDEKKEFVLSKQLLRSGYYSVTETASACGYDSVSYFSQEFKREVGMTPTEYVIEQR